MVGRLSDPLDQTCSQRRPDALDRERRLHGTRSRRPAGGLRRSHPPAARDGRADRSGAPSPSIRAPVRSISAARCRPTTAGRVTVVPNPWWKPSLAKFALNRALSGSDSEVRRQRETEAGHRWPLPAWPPRSAGRWRRRGAPRRTDAFPVAPLVSPSPRMRPVSACPRRRGPRRGMPGRNRPSRGRSPGRR